MSAEIVVSNLVGQGEIAIDRLYMGFPNKIYVINKDFSDYKGEITKRSILVKGTEGKFRSHVYKTQDGRWFDRSGMPISKPDSLERDDE